MRHFTDELGTASSKVFQFIVYYVLLRRFHNCLRTEFLAKCEEKRKLYFALEDAKAKKKTLKETIAERDETLNQC